MVFAKQDNEGKVIAWAEIRLVDETGREDAKGVYVWIHDVWVHESCRTRNKFNKAMKEFIAEGRDRFPQAGFIYWTRGKHGKRMSLYNRKNILRRTRGGRQKEARRLHSTAITGATANTVAI